MNQKDIHDLVKRQDEFFHTGQTRNVKFRKTQLKKLRSTIFKYQDRIYEALWKDLHKNKMEVWATEIGLVLQEIKYMLRNLSNWSRPQPVGNPILMFRANSMIVPEPHGRVLILSPWNYPFQLLINPLVGAIAAGNCAIIRPSSNTPNTLKVMEKLILECFPEKYIALVDGPRETVDLLLEEKFDYIFFTGSSAVGKKIMERASRNLTPVSLELGGKNPCFVTRDADLNLAARRIVWGKFLNGGQSCVAIDYLLVDQEIKQDLVERITYYIEKFYGSDPSQSQDLTYIVNSANVVRLKELIRNADIILGGDNDPETRYFAPTLVDNVKLQDPLMQEEIFGPVLPILEYQDLDEAIALVNNRPTPLCVYVISPRRSQQWDIFSRTRSGFSGFNDSAILFANPNLPVGGKGMSGFGKYHGKKSFDTFTHYRSVFIKKNKIDLPLRYPPQTKCKFEIIRYLLR